MAEPFSDDVAGHPNRTEKRLIFRHNAIPHNDFCTCHRSPVSPFAVSRFAPSPPPSLAAVRFRHNGSGRDRRSKLDLEQQANVDGPHGPIGFDHNGRPSLRSMRDPFRVANVNERPVREAKCERLKWRGPDNLSQVFGSHFCLLRRTGSAVEAPEIPLAPRA